MVAATLKSRPIYPGLVPRAGSLHLFVVDESGARAASELARKTPVHFWEKADVVYVPSGMVDAVSEDAAFAGLTSLGPRSVHKGASLAAVLPRIQHVLGRACMGANLYVAGTEGLIGQVTKLALEAGMELECILAEHCGSLARRVQCVHCKGITENVTTQPATCAHCGLHLFVRDHYSRRLAAFQGVSIDAEEPGVLPPSEEIFK